MKKERLKLEDLKVKSFVTEFADENENTLKGGTGSPFWVTIPMSLFATCDEACRDGGGEGTISDVVAQINGHPPACLLDPVIVLG